MAYTKTVHVDRIVQYANRYTLTDLGGGVYTIDPNNGTVTYEGTPQNAVVFNNIENELEKLDPMVTSERTVTILATDWVGTSAPYTAIITDATITDTMKPKLALNITSGLTAEQTKLYKKNTGMIDRLVTNNGSITFYCNVKKPITDFSVKLIGE